MYGYLLWLLFAFLVLCRAAVSGEVAADAGPVDPISIFWKALFDNGPLGLFLAYMLHRENKRDKLDAQNREKEEKRQTEREKKEEEHRREWVAVIRNNTEAATQGAATSAQLCTEVEKTRIATYQTRDIVIKQAGGLREPDAGNTRAGPRQ